MAGALTRGETLRSFHLFILGASGLAFVLSSVNLNLVSFVLPELREPWGLEPWELALPLTANAVGGVAGSAIAGQLADRFGRRVVFQIVVGTFAGATLLSALAPNLAILAAAQVFAGLGITGLTPATTSLIAETVPARLRGRLTAFLESFWVLGGLLAAVAALVLMPVVGWRGVLAFGGLAALYVFLVRRLVPESPRYLVARGRIADAFAERERLWRRWGVSLELPTAGLLAEGPLNAVDRFRELWSSAYRRRTLCLWSLWFAQVFSYRGIFSWLPTFLVLVGQTPGEARFSLVLISLAQFPGTVGAALLVDRIGRKPLLLMGLGICGMACGLFGFVSHDPLWATAVAAVIGAANLTSYAVTLVYTPELYPTRSRATGVGMASSFGRVAAVAAPVAVGALLEGTGVSMVPIFLLFAGALAAGAVVVAAIGPETRGAALEEISR